MKEDKEIEKILLNDEEYNKFINSKTEHEFIKEVEYNNSVSGKSIDDITKVPKEKLFSRNTIYIVMNRKSRTKSYINGIQAEGFLGTQNIQRENFLSGKAASFVSGDNYVKFYKYKV